MPGMCFFVRKQTLALLTAGLLTAPLSPAYGQVNNKAYADYFLVGQFGEVCTMCDVMVLCEAGATPPAHQSVPADGKLHALPHTAAHLLVAGRDDLGVVHRQFQFTATRKRSSAAGHDLHG